MRPEDYAIAVRFKERLLHSLGGRLQRVLAFGSRARGVCGPDSDLDLLVVLDHADPATRRAVAHLAADQELEEAEPICISPLVMDQARLDRLRQRERLLSSELDRDGVEV